LYSGVTLDYTLSVPTSASRVVSAITELLVIIIAVVVVVVITYLIRIKDFYSLFIIAK